MPNIVNSRGVHLTEDVVRIGDAFPSRILEKQRMYTEQEEAGKNHVVILDAYDMARLARKKAVPVPSGPDVPQTAPEPEPMPSLLAAEMLQNAEEEAARLLSEARTQAEAERERILGEAMAEAESLRQEALAAGHREGYESCVAGARSTTEALEAAVARMEGEVAGFEAEYEEQLKWMAMEIATRVLNRKVAENDAILTSMVGRVVQGLKNEAWVRVEVAQEMTRLIGQLQDLFDDQEQIEVSAIPADPGTILVETPSGVVDASLHTQLENLKQYFQKNVG